MLSLKRSMDQLEQAESGLQTAAKCYVSAIRTVEEQSVTLDTPWSSYFHHDLRCLCRKLAGQTSPGLLEQGLVEFESSLSQYRGNLQQFLDGKKQDLDEIIDLLARMSTELSSHACENQEWLLRFGTRLRDVSRLQTLAEVKADLNKKFAELSAFSTRLQSNAESTIQKMQAQVDVYKARLVQAEVLAATDALTGATNRREGERALAQRIESGTQFCVLMFDLDGFKSINDRFGHPCGDEVLKNFATRLTRQTRADDVVCRWGGDEFLVIMDCGLSAATARARLLSDQCAGKHHLTTQEQSVSVFLSCAVGIAEHHPGETSADLVSRVDKMLYQNKPGARMRRSLEV